MTGDDVVSSLDTDRDTVDDRRNVCLEEEEEVTVTPSVARHSADNNDTGKSFTNTSYNLSRAAWPGTG